MTETIISYPVLGQVIASGVVVATAVAAAKFVRTHQSSRAIAYFAVFYLMLSWLAGAWAARGDIDWLYTHGVLGYRSMDGAAPWVAAVSLTTFFAMCGITWWRAAIVGSVSFGIASITVLSLASL